MKGSLFAVTVASALALALAAGCGSGGGSATECSEANAASKSCAFASSTVSGYACTSPLKSGPCSSTGLIGCCVTTISSSGDTVTSGACYYSATLATPAKAACKGSTGGGTEAWTTTAP